MPERVATKPVRVWRARARTCLAILLLWAGALSWGGDRPGSFDSAPPLRQPAVAGLFYPADAEQLRRELDRLLKCAVAPTTTARLRALIAPHAGYTYSGPVAASAFAALRGTTFSRVIVLAPSHFADFEGVAVTPADYLSPLGRLERDPLSERLAQIPPFSSRPAAHVFPPAWARAGLTEERPDTYEHALEVELPFLQHALGTFRLVPLLCGRVDPSEVAAQLLAFLDDTTLLVASSDLSHYHPYEEARQRDLRCVRAICSLDTAAMRSQEACGKIPILVVMEIAKRLGWQPILLDYRNSGDTTGDRARGVVGYAAIAFYEGAKAESALRREYTKGGRDHGVNPIPDPRANGETTPTTSARLDRNEGRFLVRLARSALEEAVRHRRRLVVDPTSVPQSLREKKGCFVTLTEEGELRGCIGHIFPTEPLYLAVIDNAWAAALEDPRFPPVEPSELSHIDIEVSVLTVPRPLAFSSPEDLLAKLRPHRDGVVLKIGSAVATFLPQVWEQLPEPEPFLAHLSRKAGCPSDAWRGPHTSVMTYEVQAFHESDF